MKAFSFWDRWLLAVSLLLTLFGLALAFLNQTPLFDALFNNRINPVFWPSTEVTQEIATFQQWAYGVLGATVAGWGIVVAFVARYPFLKRERWAWNALAVGITLWFIIDTSLSLYFKAVFNAAFNTLVFFLVWIPLLFTRKEFRSA